MPPLTRICIYRYDDGAFRRHNVRLVTSEELSEMYATMYYRVMVLDYDDYYGMSAPTIYPEHME